MAACKETNPKWKPTEDKDGHNWGVYGDDKYESCRRCGYIRRRDDKNKPCREEVKVELR